jgi:hypothetical protein
MNKYIIYQGSGGLVHLLGGLVYCCDYIKKNRNTILVIDIKNHKAFGSYFGRYFVLNNINYTEDYDDIIDKKNYYNIPLSEFNEKNVDYDKNLGYFYKSSRGNINIGKSLDKINYSNNIKMYAGNGGNNHNNIIKYIKCNKYVKEKLKEYKCNEKYIAVHFRNTDRFNDINIFINKIKVEINKNKDYKVYIATDNYNALQIFKKEFGDKIFYHFEPYNAKGENIHFNNPDKDNVIMSIIVDIYMLYHSDIFIDSPNSLVSKLVKRMRLVKESIFE